MARTHLCFALTIAALAAAGITAIPAQAADTVRIGQVQGTTDASPRVGQTVTIEGVVVGDFQDNGQFGGLYLQDAGDGDEATSDGIFIYGKEVGARTLGDRLRVTGKVHEFKGQTQINASNVTALDADAIPQPTPRPLSVPVVDPERVEGMLVTFPDALTIVEYHNFDRYGEIVYAPSRQWAPTAVASPGAYARAVDAANRSSRLIVDDGRAVQNPTPALHPDGQPLSQVHYFRGGDQASNLTGIMSFRDSLFKLQPTRGADFTVQNPRPAAPDRLGDLRIASFNVLNYFTTLTSEDPAARGADDAQEFARQQAKIVAAMTEIDADVFALMEIQNNGTAVDNLVAALNAKTGDGNWVALRTGVVGSDAIFQAFIYKPSTVELAGDFAVLDFADGKNRPSLTQTFRHRASGELVTVSVNHLKSKGSACDGDADSGDGQGNCNATRTAAATQLANWLNDDPTRQGSARTVIIGDLNSYDHEDPIRALTTAGFGDQELRFSGEHAYSYVFDGATGYLDYALANGAAAQSIVGTAAWHINADEADIFDYDMTFKKDAEDALFTPTPWRSSDHDPVIVSLKLAADAPAPPSSPEPGSRPNPIPRPTPTPPAQRPGLPQTGPSA